MILRLKLATMGCYLDVTKGPSNLDGCQQAACGPLAAFGPLNISVIQFNEQDMLGLKNLIWQL
jgi:hypothetical protein